MSLESGEVLQRLLQVIESSFSNRLSRLHVVRDLRGRIRIAARENPEAPGLNRDELVGAIRDALGEWFSGAILWDGGSGLEQQRLAQRLLSQPHGWPENWPSTWDDGAGVPKPRSAGVWSGEERLRSKQSWLVREPSTPPWPLLPQAPAIVSFYSFKGGVGRTTTLGLVARLLARAGHRVVVLDLDLEAPGLGRFFGFEADRGVLDLLVEHLATRHIDPADLDRHCREVELDGGAVTVFPAGRVDWGFIEKLGRLDFAPEGHQTGQSPIEKALREVLAVIRNRYHPDFILLDARAGLHDLGGLSIHALSHLDVLVGRRGTATSDGLKLALQAIQRCRRPADHRVVVVQTFVPLPLTGLASVALQEDWRTTLWDLFADTLDAVGEGDRPGVDDRTARHHPWPVPAYDAVASADTIQEIDAATKDAEPFTVIRDRIRERCLRMPPGVAAGEEQAADDL